MTKFQYAPGTPGYGLKGSDGSTGLIGFSTYGSDYNAISNSTILNSRILTNTDLYSTGGSYIPGYPTRTYQTGDLFIDGDGDIYRIDLSNTPNKFVATGISFTISDFFTYTGLNTAGFERWSNKVASGSDPKVVDTVYSSTIENYSSYPSEIYGNDPLDYGQIFYNDQSPVNDYEPYTIWISGDASTNDKNAIALVRDSVNNAYRLGNLSTAAAQRDVSLSLDFSNVNINGNLKVDNVFYGSGVVYNSAAGLTNDSYFKWTNAGTGTKLLELDVSNARIDIGDGVGTGSLQIFAATDEYAEILLRSGSGICNFGYKEDVDQFYISNGTVNAEFKNNGNVELNYNGSKKFETTSAGAYVTGDLAINGDVSIIGISSTQQANYLQYNATTGAVTYFNDVISSDIRLKNIESPILNVLPDLITLSTIHYRWNELAMKEMKFEDSSTLHIGLIAQEVEEVFPYLVSEVKGSSGEYYKGISYKEFPSIFVQAFKEQQEQIEDLKNIVEKQQEQINQLLNL